jgi:hypothetical protein
MNVTPDTIMGFFNFSPVDGSLPVDRTAQANLWKDMMSNLRMMPPQVAMGFDWVKIFTWVGSLAGLKNINQFKIQLVPDGSMTGQVQAGKCDTHADAAATRASAGSEFEYCKWE